ncbi:outer membrane receptor protein involved in Fe transport [Caulobacter ginsengisoli]|uniref:Outer membrane receptor protein involved in Fe transport n=1 Tax=Caulobacter ginsengisoli TaxID=400775 RepID=A0ABU0IKY7_9CAUL|nr:TonB-dependent receptor [Caulobacter ginsengisoli]MDQ0462685.1 outer membrane receptor protein involved in Fe transport [Caulobacter ginsengisoli]
MPLDAPPPVATVTVQAARLPASPTDAAFSVISLDAETIATAPRLDDALTAVPGVQLFRRTSSQAANPTTQGISLRGIAGSGAGRALVTLDGAPQNDPFGGWVIWSGLPNAGIESVQIVRGAGAGPYGAGALTGVIQLSERTQVPANGEYSLEGAERGGAFGSAALAYGDVFFVASAQRTDGWTPVQKGAGLADQPLGFRSASAAIRYAPDLGGLKLALRAAAYQESRDSGLAGAASRSVGASASATLTGGSVGLGTDWRLQAWLRSSDLENSSVAVAPGRNTTTPANDQYGTPALGYGFNAALRGRTWEIGADLRAASGETREHFRFLAGAFTRGRVAGGDQYVAGLYAETWRDDGPWLLTGGVRLDRWSDSGGKRIERDLATSAVTLDNRPADQAGWQPTARAAVRYSLSDNGYWRAAAYAGFRPPTLNELHRPFRVGNDVTEANPGLEPEKLYGVEAGLGGTDWTLTLFANRLEGAVTNVTIGFGPGVFPLAGFIPAGGVLRQRQNAGDIDAWGLEGEVHHDWSDGWLRLAAGYTEAKVDGGSSAPQLTGLRPAQTPRLTASAEAGWRPADAVTLRAAARYEASRFDDDLNSRVLGAATTLDLRADWRVTPSAALYAALDNATDTSVETAQTADGISSYDAPRTFRIGIVWRP